MPNMTLTRRTSFILFAALSIALLACETWIATLVEKSQQPSLVAAAITVDLAVGVPLLYYFLLARKRFLPLSGVVLLFVLMLVAVRLILPPSQRSQIVFLQVLIPAIELTSTLFLLFKLRSIIGDTRKARVETLYFADALRIGIQKSLGSNLAATLLATEISMVYFVVLGWFTRFKTDRRDISIHSYHRRSSFVLFFWALVALMVVEAGLMHLIVGIWTQVGAWILTALNAYTLMWLIGHFQAARLQPVIVDSK